MKPVLVVPGTEFLRAYAGTQYLIEELYCNGVALRVLMRCELPQKEEYRRLPYDISVWPYSVDQNLLIRKLVSATFKTVVFFKALGAKNVLTTEATHLRPIAWAKRLKPSLQLIQFCQELHLPEDYPDRKQARDYATYARVPDIVIDVEPHRAAVRKDKAGLTRDPLVLMNTMPLKKVAAPAPSGTLSRLARTCFPSGVPVLLHAGGIGKEKPLERVIDAVALCKRDVFFLAFCSGREADIRRLTDYAASKLAPGMFCICNAVPRAELFPALHEADIGVIDYTYSVEQTLNQKFCAPTKLFELMAHGVAILGSNNESLRNIIERRGIGKCAEDDSIEALSEALTALVSTPDKITEMKHRAIDLFRESYSYEQICVPVINKLISNLRR